MKQKCKKLLSVLLSIVMIFSITASIDLSAYASATQIYGGNSKATATNIEYSKEYALIMTEGGTKWFKFSTKNDPIYWYNATVKNVSVGNNNGFRGVSACIYDEFDEKFADAGAFNGGSGTDGGKLEENTTYYLAIWCCREGTIKFQLDAVLDDYGETKSQASIISFDKYYEAKIDSPGELSDNREGDNLGGDVDYVKFYTGNSSKIRFYLFNSDVDYYNTYFEGIAAIVTDSFGEQYAYLEIRPTCEGISELELNKNTYYYIKFFSTSGAIGNYKFKIECIHSWNDGEIIEYPDCTKSGVKMFTCKDCGATKNVTIAAKGHTYKTYTTRATTSAAGKIVTKCSVCGTVKSTQTIARISSVELSGTSYTYNGKVKTPTVTVKDRNGRTLVKNTDYTVSYASGRKNVGKYAVKVTFKGKYSGTKTLYFTIKPKATSIKSLSAGSKKFTVKWYKRTTQTTGYQVQYSTSSKFTSPKIITISKTGTTSKTVKKLKAKKKYYVRVRTYKTVNGTRYYSSWSKYKKVTTKS